MSRIHVACLVFAAAAVLAAPAAAKVNVIRPPVRPVAEVPAEPAAPVIHVRTTIVVNVIPFETRAMVRRRALFQTWSGFVKEYSGPRYPF